ncbi:MAG: GatB/YqeY domain-containing protein [bacterium]|nr:GatB/YqeY domain-containing protein [bacterium]
MLLDLLRQDLNNSLKSKEALRASVLRLLLAEVKNTEISLRLEKRTVGDEEIITVLNHQVKQRKESIAEYTRAGRLELAAKEEEELKILQTYLPSPLSEQELMDLVAKSIQQTGAVSVKDFGRVMADLMPKVKGRADGSQLSALVKERLE